MWDSTTVIGVIPSFSILFGELLECGVFVGCGVVLTLNIRQLLSIASGLHEYASLSKTVFYGC